MSDLFRGQTQTEAFKLISGGAAYTLSLNFQPDLVIFNNLTQWTNTAAGLPRSFWFRDQTDAAEAYQQQVIDSSAGASFNFLNPVTNGFTVADTSGGVSSLRALISGVTAADPVVITTTAAHGFQSGQIVRVTDLGQVTAATNRGMGQLNNLKFKITVVDATSFSLQDAVTGEDIDGSAYTAWVSGGRVDIESHTLSLNNPEAAAYTGNPYAYDPVEYKLTAGSSVMGADGDVYLVQSMAFGLVTQLGDIG